MILITKIKNTINNIFDKSGNKQIVHLTYFFAILFIALIAYIVIFMFTESDEVINNSYNKREELYAEKVTRGSIISADDKILAYTDSSSGKDVRVYPYGKTFAHVVGYNSKGKAGLESICTFKLLKSDILITERIENDAKGIKNPGNSIITTLDTTAQTAACNAMSGCNGAIVLMNAKTGDIISLVSKPDFDPNNIDVIWDDLTADSSVSTLLNRATQGLYPPGSTFKILTALEYLREHNNDTEDYSFDCSGSYSYDGSTINCYHGQAHGSLDFNLSFAESCNSSFANITTTLNKTGFKNTCEDLLFNDEIPCPLYTEKSSVPIDSSSDTDELIQTGIGQGKTSITPYHMCLISAAIANDGVLVKPRLIDKIVTAAGDTVEENDCGDYKRLLSTDDSAKLKLLMRDVVTDGTATKLRDTAGYTAYGKTGSAEFSSDKSRSHAWFTGFAEADNGDVIAISVIIEDGGSGGAVAVPVAKAVFDAYLN